MKHTVKEWFLVTRPWGYPVSLFPAIIALSYVFYLYHLGGGVMEVNWWYGVIATIGAAIWQASGNMMSDYYDYKYNVDRIETYGTGRMLVEKVFTPKEVYNYSLTLMGVGTVIGLFFIIGLPSDARLNLLWIGLVGAFGSYFYYYMKFNAFGDLNIFILYGLFIALGTFLVMTNELSWQIMLIAGGPGLIIVAVLHANNVRDIKHDTVVNIKTFAMVLGLKTSKQYYAFLLIGSYVSIIIAVVIQILHPVSLIVLLSLPLMVKMIKKMNTAKIEEPELIKILDEETAKYYSAFAVLLILSNFIAGFIVK